MNVEINKHGEYYGCGTKQGKPVYVCNPKTVMVCGRTNQY